MIFKQKKHLIFAFAMTFLSSGVFALDGHIEGNSCFSNAGPGEVQGAEGSGQCDGAGVSCNYMDGTCTMSLAAHDAVKQIGILKGKKVTITQDIKKESMQIKKSHSE